MSLPQSFELWGYRFVPSYLTGMCCWFVNGGQDNDGSSSIDLHITITWILFCTCFAGTVFCLPVLHAYLVPLEAELDLVVVVGHYMDSGSVLNLWAISPTPFTLFLREDLIETGQWTPGICLSLPPCLWDYRCLPGFNISTRDLNSGPPAYKESTLLIEHSLSIMWVPGCKSRLLVLEAGTIILGIFKLGVVATQL